jgi:hypothetical protein
MTKGMGLLVYRIFLIGRKSPACRNPSRWLYVEISDSRLMQQKPRIARNAMFILARPSSP